jgi:hypothetical protein
MNKLKFYLFILNFLLIGTILFAQNEGSKPFMKITIKDGKVVKTATLDATINQFQLSNSKADKDYSPNKTICASMIEDSGYNPNRATQTSMNEDPNYNPNKAVQSSILEVLNDSTKEEKGKNFPQKFKYSEKILDLKSVVKINKSIDNDKEKLAPKDSIKSVAGWVTIMSEGFEGSFPGTIWDVYANAGYTDAYWDDQNYRAYNGSWSGWCAYGGSENASLGTNYPNNMNSWMIYGPFDLSDANDAELNFKYWNISESSYDYFGYYASLNGTNFYGMSTSGNSGGWQSGSLDLTNLYTLGNITGQPQVWIAFRFGSDISGNFEGAYIDDIVLQKYTSSTPLPDLTCTNIAKELNSWEQRYRKPDR